MNGLIVRKKAVNGDDYLKRYGVLLRYCSDVRVLKQDKGLLNIIQ